jgi:hypothetical protein
MSTPILYIRPDVPDEIDMMLHHRFPGVPYIDSVRLVELTGRFEDGRASLGDYWALLIDENGKIHMIEIDEQDEIHLRPVSDDDPFA